MTRTIEIIVSPTGQSQIETKGFAGSECLDASRFLERALGKNVSEKLTPEFHQPRVVSEQHERQQGWTA